MERGATNPAGDWLRHCQAKAALPEATNVRRVILCVSMTGSVIVMAAVIMLARSALLVVPGQVPNGQ